MEAIIVFWFCSFYLKYQVQEKQALAHKLCYSYPASDGPCLNIKVHKPRVYRRCKCHIGASILLEGKTHVSISLSIESPFLIYPAN